MRIADLEVRARKGPLAFAPVTAIYEEQLLDFIGIGAIGNFHEESP
jgi:hypothetical protein